MYEDSLLRTVGLHNFTKYACVDHKYFEFAVNSHQNLNKLTCASSRNSCIVQNKNPCFHTNMIVLKNQIMGSSLSTSRNNQSTVYLNLITKLKSRTLSNSYKVHIVAMQANMNVQEPSRMNHISFCTTEEMRQGTHSVNKNESNIIRSKFTQNLGASNCFY